MQQYNATPTEVCGDAAAQPAGRQAGHPTLMSMLESLEIWKTREARISASVNTAEERMEGGEEVGVKGWLLSCMKEACMHAFKHARRASQPADACLHAGLRAQQQGARARTQVALCVEAQRLAHGGGAVGVGVQHQLAVGLGDAAQALQGGPHPAAGRAAGGAVGECEKRPWVRRQGKHTAPSL